MTHALLVAVMLAGAVRFGLLVWGGYRNGRVKSAALWSRYYDRNAQPRVFWAFMSLHLLAIVTFIGCAIAVALGWVG